MGQAVLSAVGAECLAIEPLGLGEFLLSDENGSQGSHVHGNWQTPRRSNPAPDLQTFASELLSTTKMSAGMFQASEVVIQIGKEEVAIRAWQALVNFPQCASVQLVGDAELSQILVDHP